MAGSKRSKRVSWPTDGNLCKVRLFLSEDAPYQSGLGTQDNLQAKAAWLLHAGGLNESDDSLPPGFEEPYKFQPKIEISQIPLISWHCPHKLALNQEWLVVAGEESEEAKKESVRQQGVLEAIYPRTYSIPPNPLISQDVQATRIIEDSRIPLIPVIAIEDEDVNEQSEFDTLSPTNNPVVQLHSIPDVERIQNCTPDHKFTSTNLQSQINPRSTMIHVPRSEQQPPSSSSSSSSSSMPTALTSPGAEPDVFAAASAAFTAITKSNEDSLIDRDLLIKILNDPSMVNKLLPNYNTPKQIQPPTSQPVIPTSAPPKQTQPPTSQPVIPTSTPPTSHNFIASHALNHRIVHPPCPPPFPNLPFASSERAPQVKDANYYKSLIQLHGGEKQQTQIIGNTSQRELKAKIQKPCTFFNTPRGCRHGASCLYLHDASLIIDQQTGPSKRIKLDGGIAGRN